MPVGSAFKDFITTKIAPEPKRPPLDDATMEKIQFVRSHPAYKKLQAQGLVPEGLEQKFDRALGAERGAFVTDVLGGSPVTPYTPQVEVDNPLIGGLMNLDRLNAGVRNVVRGGKFVEGVSNPGAVESFSQTFAKDRKMSPETAQAYVDFGSGGALDKFKALPRVAADTAAELGMTAAGLGTDIVTDPLTYATAGLAPFAKQIGKSALQQSPKLAALVAKLKGAKLGNLPIFFDEGAAAAKATTKAAPTSAGVPDDVLSMFDEAGIQAPRPVAKPQAALPAPPTPKLLQKLDTPVLKTGQEVAGPGFVVKGGKVVKPSKQVGKALRPEPAPKPKAPVKTVSLSPEDLAKENAARGVPQENIEELLKRLTGESAEKRAPLAAPEKPGLKSGIGKAKRKVTPEIQAAKEGVPVEPKATVADSLKKIQQKARVDKLRLEAEASKPMAETPGNVVRTAAKKKVREKVQKIVGESPEVKAKVAQVTDEIAKLKKQKGAMEIRAKKLRDSGKLIDAIGADKEVSRLNSRILDLEKAPGKDFLDKPLPKIKKIDADVGPKKAKKVSDDDFYEAKFKELDADEDIIDLSDESLINLFGKALEGEEGMVGLGKTKSKTKTAAQKELAKRGKETTKRGATAKFIKSNLDSIQREADKRGTTLENALKNFKDASGKKVFDEEQATRLAAKYGKPPVEADIKPGTFVRDRRTADMGEIMSVDKDVVKVRFADGLSEYKPKDVVDAKTGVTIVKDYIPNIDTVDVAEKMWVRKAATKPGAQVTDEYTQELLEQAYRDPVSPVREPLIKQVSKQMADLIDDGVIKGDGINRLLDKYGMTPLQLAKDIKESASTGGQILNRWSQVRRQLKSQFKDDPELMKFLSKETENENFVLAWVGGQIKTAERLYQAALISQPATAARNFYMGNAHLGIDLVNEFIAGSFQKLTKTGIAGQEFTPLKVKSDRLSKEFGDIYGSLKRVAQKAMGKPVSKDAYVTLLDNLPEEGKAALLNTSIGDAAFTDVVSRRMTMFNHIQERFIRRISSEGFLVTRLQQHGFKDVKGFADITPKMWDFLKGRPDIFNEMVDHSLKISFANQPEYAIGKMLTQIWRKIPGSAFTLPFMRFATMSMEWTLHHSPLGLVRLFTPKAIKTIAGPNNAKQARVIAEATTGAILMGLGYAIRSNPTIAGDKWYEIKVGKHPKTGEQLSLDMRPFFPLVPYLFMAEAFKNLTYDEKKDRASTKLTATDWVEGLSGMRTLAGSPLAITAAFKQLEAGNKVGSVETLEKVVGQIIGGYTTPARTFSDIYSIIDEKEAIPRSVKENNLWGPAMNNIPKLKQLLPPVTTQTRGLAPVAFNPAVRQFTGIGFTRRTPIEQEAARLGIFLNPKLGDPKAESVVMEASGPIVNEVGNNIVKSDFYQNASDYDRGLIIKAIAEEYKSVATEAVKDMPFKKLQEKRLKDEEERIIKKIIKNLLP